ncbi:hypothetical protein E4T48_06424 [Aureobasidium sp. EXF-10727]|nr:hypothetical protein E4T48_06424 [Aureobasidium sp. EXF-10727]KAI4725280.1 hypothetical protein E4T49_07005 [Aureobasidium sp. EXF-10728]
MATPTNPTNSTSPSQSSQTPTIRLATPSDVDAIAALIDAAYTPYITRLNGKKPGPMTADHAACVASSSVYILVSSLSTAIATTADSITADTTSLLGCISLTLASHSSSPPALEINNLAISPCSQGKGYGKLLLKFAESKAKELGCAKMELYTNVKMVENLVLYEKLGYREVGRWEQEGFERVFFEKEVV